MKKIIGFVIAQLLLLALVSGCNRPGAQNSARDNDDGRASSRSSRYDDDDASDSDADAPQNGNADGSVTSPRQADPDVPESAPKLDAVIIDDKQRARAIQLTTNWSIHYEDGTGYDYSSDSAGPLQVHPREYDDATLWLKNENAVIELQFSDNYPPLSITAQCWPFEYVTGLQDAHEIYGYSGEPVKVKGTSITVSSGWVDHVYEVHAEWPNGNSYYAFRVVSDAQSGTDAIGSNPVAPAQEPLTYYEALALANAWVDAHADLTSYAVQDWSEPPDDIPPPTYSLYGTEYYDFSVSYEWSADYNEPGYSHHVLVDAVTGELLSLYFMWSDADNSTTTLEPLDDWYGNEQVSYPPARLTADDAIDLYNKWVYDHFNSPDYNIRRQPSGEYTIFGERYYYFRAVDDWKYYYNILVNMQTGELIYLQFEDGMYGGTYIEPLDDWYNRYFGS